MGVGKRANQLCSIDYGLAKNYVNPKLVFHVPTRRTRGCAELRDMLR